MPPQSPGLQLTADSGLSGGPRPPGQSQTSTVALYPQRNQKHRIYPYLLGKLLIMLIRPGRPEIFNADQGRQFTSEAFTAVLREQGIQISMEDEG